MFTTVFILSIVIALLLGGSFRTLARSDIRGVEWFLIGFLAEMLLDYAASRTPQAVGPWIIPVDVLVYGTVLWGVWLNRHLWGMILVGAGSVLNALVIFANGGRMPVAAQALARAGIGDLVQYLAAGRSGTHGLMGAGTHLRWLGDIFAMPPWSFRPAAFSIGDMLIGIGIMLVMIRLMGAPRPWWRRSTSPA